jgi:hypothetical protein
VRKRQLFHHAPSDEVFLDNSLQRLRPGRVIPSALRIDYRDGTPIADAQAIGARAIDPVEQSELSQPPLQVSPRLQTLLAGAALRFGLVGAEKNVPLYAREIQLGGAFQNAFGIGHRGY